MQTVLYFSLFLLRIYAVLWFCLALCLTSYHTCPQVNDSECNSIELSVTGSGHTVKGYAVFDGPTLTGRVTFVGSHLCRNIIVNNYPIK